jgi:acetate kinase
MSVKILVINSGSSSIKYQLFDMTDQGVLASGLLEKIGEQESILTHKTRTAQDTMDELKKSVPIKNHSQGLQMIWKEFSESGAIEDPASLAGIGHRVVHGGETFKGPALIDDGVLQSIKKLVPLAPLHNPANITGIEVARELCPSVPQVAVFDTSFHQTLPPHAFHYALPYEYYEDMGVRRYGFHGTSHNYVAKEAARLMEKPLEEINLITVHLGSGVSVCAIKGGKSVDTSMGMTPVAGMFMGTRCGNIDPGVLLYVAKKKGFTIEEMDTVLNKQSGLKGLCGSNDFRDIHARIAQGDPRARLAHEMFTFQVKKYIGSYCAVLGHVDAIVFTAGIGEHDIDTREICCSNLEQFGIVFDPDENRKEHRQAFRISRPESRVQVFVIPTNEELEIATQTRNVLKQKQIQQQSITKC